MGMPITLALRGKHADDALGARAWNDVVASLRKADRMFSTHRSDSEISEVNDGSRQLADVSRTVAGVLAIAERARRDSDGAFDVWFDHADGGRRLDPSGVVKGWAVERAAKLLEDLEATDFCLSAGGDMVCRTRAQGSPGWRVGIEDPRNPTRIIAILPMTNGAVATSGTVHRGAHLVDARTGLSPAGVGSVTVISASLTWADIDATAAYAHGRDAARWLSTRPDRTALVVWADGSVSSVRTSASGSTTVSEVA